MHQWIYECLYMLSKIGVDLDCVDKHQQTPMFYAARRGNPEAVAFLIRFGCKVDWTDTHLQTPLYFACLTD